MPITSGPENRGPSIAMYLGRPILKECIILLNRLCEDVGRIYTPWTELKSLADPKGPSTKGSDASLNLYYYPKPRYQIIGYLDPLAKNFKKAHQPEHSTQNSLVYSKPNTPRILNPRPQTPNPRPNPRPQTLNPKPQTPNPKPQTLNPQAHINLPLLWVPNFR